MINPKEKEKVSKNVSTLHENQKNPISKEIKTPSDKNLSAPSEYNLTLTFTEFKGQFEQKTVYSVTDRRATDSLLETNENSTDIDEYIFVSSEVLQEIWRLSNCFGEFWIVQVDDSTEDFFDLKHAVEEFYLLFLSVSFQKILIMLFKKKISTDKLKRMQGNLELGWMNYLGLQCIKNPSRPLWRF